MGGDGKGAGELDENTDLDTPAFGPSALGFGPRGDSIPAVSVQAPAPTPVLRRDESVLREAAKVRLAPIRQVTEAAAQLGGGMASARRVLGEASILLLNRFERLPRWQQATWVAAPYLGALGLVVALFASRPPPGNVAIEPVPTLRARTTGAAYPSTPAPSTGPDEIRSRTAAERADGAARADTIRTDADGADTIRTDADGADTLRTDADGADTIRTGADGAGKTPARSGRAGGIRGRQAFEMEVAEVADVRRPTDTSATEPSRLSDRQSVPLTLRSALYARPDARSPRTARLRAGHIVTVFPSFPSPTGWVLARSERGTVGFISALHLTGQEDPEVTAADRARRRRRAP